MAEHIIYVGPGPQLSPVFIPVVDHLSVGFSSLQVPISTPPQVLADVTTHATIQQDTCAKQNGQEFGLPKHSKTMS
jgi:hypothetical protein